jgi:hypothetical protein
VAYIKFIELFTVGGVSATYNLKKSSIILKGEIAFIKQLQKWLGEKCKWNLCYRASRDGMSAKDFHKHCDNKGPTVVLVKANDCICGGYTDQNWESGIQENIYLLIEFVQSRVNGGRLGQNHTDHMQK